MRPSRPAARARGRAPRRRGDSRRASMRAPRASPRRLQREHRASLAPVPATFARDERPGERPSDPRPARDRAAQRGRPRAARHLPRARPRRARLRDDARRGDVARGEESMAFVADRAGVEVVRLPACRELSAVWDPVAAWRLARIIRQVRPDVVHTHTAKAGAVGRAARCSQASALGPSSCTRSTGTCSAATSAGPDAALPAIETALARATDRLVAVSPEVRDELVGLHVAPPRSSRWSARDRARAPGVVRRRRH